MSNACRQATYRSQSLTVYQLLLQKLSFSDILEKDYLIVNPGINRAFNCGFVQTYPVWTTIKLNFSPIIMCFATAAEIDQQAAPGFYQIHQPRAGDFLARRGG